MYESGVDIARLCADLMNVLKEALIYNDSPDGSLLKLLKPTEAQEILRIAAPGRLLKDADLFADVLTKRGQNLDLYSYLELAVLKIASENASAAACEAEQPTKKALSQPALPPQPEPEPPAPVYEETLPQEPEIQDVPELPQEPEELPEEEPPADEIPEDISYSDEELADMLLTARKEDKTADEEKIYSDLESYSYEEKERRFYAALRQTTIFGSNEEFIIFRSTPIARMQINEAEFNRDLYFFLRDKMKVDKMCYAMEDAEFRERIVPLYLRAKQEGRKPEFHVRRYQQTEEERTKELTPEDKLQDLFGNIVKVEDN